MENTYMHTSGTADMQGTKKKTIRNCSLTSSVYPKLGSVRAHAALHAK